MSQPTSDEHPTTRGKNEDHIQRASEASLNIPTTNEKEKSKAEQMIESLHKILDDDKHIPLDQRSRAPVQVQEALVRQAASIVSSSLTTIDKKAIKIISDKNDANKLVVEAIHDDCSRIHPIHGPITGSWNETCHVMKNTPVDSSYINPPLIQDLRVIDQRKVAVKSINDDSIDRVEVKTYYGGTAHSVSRTVVKGQKDPIRMEVSLDNLYPVSIYSSTSMYYEVESCSQTNKSLDKVGVKGGRGLREQNQNEIHFFKSSPNDSLGIVSVVDVTKTDILDSLVCPDKSGNNDANVDKNTRSASALLQINSNQKSKKKLSPSEVEEQCVEQYMSTSISSKGNAVRNQVVSNFTSLLNPSLVKEILFPDSTNHYVLNKSLLGIDNFCMVISDHQQGDVLKTTNSECSSGGIDIAIKGSFNQRMIQSVFNLIHSSMKKRLVIEYSNKKTSPSTSQHSELVIHEYRKVINHPNMMKGTRYLKRGAEALVNCKEPVEETLKYHQKLRSLQVPLS